MNENHNPLVSVIIATYRRKDSLYKAVESVISQTYNSIEIIIVDDNADPKWNQLVNDILKDFFADERIIYIKNENNLGSAETRNIGIKMAKGKYITFLDDDDIYLSEKIRNQVCRMEETNAEYSITDLILYRENEKIEEIRKRTFITKTDKESLLKYHLKYHLTGTDTIMFKKTYLESIGLFDKIDVGDEFYLMIKAIQGNGNFIYIPICDVKAYIHTGDSGLSSGDTKIYGEKILYKYKKQYFNLLDYSTIRYIKMRHYAVLAFAYLRMRKYVNAVIEGVMSFCNAPIQCLKLLLSRNQRSITFIKTINSEEEFI